MVFSSLIFLWLFMPVVLVGYYIVPDRFKNFFLLLVSLFFYAWGEPVYVLLMLASILINWLLGILMDGSTRGKKLILTADIIINIGLLVVFKYLGFLAQTINACFGTAIPVAEIALPIGISFFTFQILSYEIDLYRGKYRAQRNVINLALYISFFPQLIAGPIVKYKDVNEQLKNRVHSPQKAMEGIRRFLYGLGKKVLLANVLAECVDRVYALDMNDVTGWMAWAVAIMYMLEIYYDFSGYSDMAIGLGKIVGFDFQENFNYPYLSASIGEFWRRWHISLSTWFKEYLYIPLGGNRKGKVRTYLNLFIVFVVTGLWHGASMNFLLWGIYHGVFQIAERLGLKKILERCRILSYIYTAAVVLFGWVLFRAETLPQALDMMKRMLIPWQYPATSVIWQQLFDHRSVFTAAAGIIGCGIFQAFVKKLPAADRWKYSCAELAYCAAIAVFSIAALAGNTYNPFIYFRF